MGEKIHTYSYVYIHISLEYLYHTLKEQGNSGGGRIAITQIINPAFLI